MITAIRNKIKALVSDFANSSEEAFVYTTSSIFTIAQDNITISTVAVNGVTAGVTYTYSSTTNKVTVTSALSTGDVILVSYTYYKYSSAELDEYIRAALVFISVYSYEDSDYELESGDVISPTPDNKTTDEIALIASILINPDWTSYKLPNVSVVYPRKMPKEERIEKLIGKYNSGLGISDRIDFDNFQQLNLL